MDFVKALMLYMALTFASSVQSAPIPGEPPEETAVPQQVLAVATATPAGDGSLVVGSVVITPDPNATPMPTPVPTLTPNPKYKVIRYGDHGSSVKKLQQRLIELGYLNPGDDDSAFGYQTLRAVRAFQTANGLSADGDAGPATLTQLYENPDAVRNPDAPTPTPDPAATPDPNAEPTDPTEGWLPVEGVTVLMNGQTLALRTEENGVTTQRRLHFWLRRGEPMLRLDELAGAVEGWSLVTVGVEAATLVAAGYELDLFVTADPVWEDYRDSYGLTLDGTVTQVPAGSVMTREGVWYVTGSFLQQMLGASVTWDADESTLILRVADKSMAVD